MGRKVNQKELAEIWGYSERIVQDYVREGMPVEEPGKPGRSSVIDSAVATQWLLKRTVEKKLEATKGGRSIENQRERLTKAQADEAELRARRSAGELVPIEDVREVLQNFFIYFGRQLDGMAARLSQPLSSMRTPGECKRVLLDEIRRVRGSAADRLEGLGIVRRDLEAIPAAAKPNAEPMGERGKKAPRRKRDSGRLPK